MPSEIYVYKVSVMALCAGRLPFPKLLIRSSAFDAAVLDEIAWLSIPDTIFILVCFSCFEFLITEPKGQLFGLFLFSRLQRCKTLTAVSLAWLMVLWYDVRCELYVQLINLVDNLRAIVAVINDHCSKNSSVASLLALAATAMLITAAHRMLLTLGLFCCCSVSGTAAWRHHNNHSCHGCAEARDELAKIRLEQIKREILEKLGLDGPPQVRPQDGFPTIPQVAKYLKYHLRYDSAAAAHMQSSFLADELTLERKTERTIVLAERVPPRYNLDTVVGYFKFSGELMSKLLHSAVLNVFLRKPSVLQSDSRIVAVQVLVKEVLRNGSVIRCLHSSSIFPLSLAPF
ncbi:unnamed protein product [Gongylonema pulchrum]|uniref:Uncharacterized protein n=1 Tax=Gongylonema pulchrum TaxID=637853 RepID=A0A3P6Q737_9BILA|nr:unnamed protein product [Gongylonema pulchrum]